MTFTKGQKPWNKGKQMPQISGENCHFFKHGFKGKPFYVVWKHMRSRCLNPNDKSYKDYGKRGIKICKRWNKFENFRDDLYPSYLKHLKEFGRSETFIDRINNNGNYELNNCRWATRKEQNRNKTDSIYLTFNGETKHIEDWVKITGFKKLTIWTRLHRGWTIEDALTKPLMKNQYDY